MDYLNCAWKDDTTVPDSIVKEVSGMLSIDMANLSGEVMETINNLGRLNRTLYQINVEITDLENEIKKEKMRSLTYYLEQYPKKLSATELKYAIDADQDICKIEAQLKVANAKYTYFKETSDVLKSKLHGIREIIKWEMYTQGNT